MSSVSSPSPHTHSYTTLGQGPIVEFAPEPNINNHYILWFRNDVTQSLGIVGLQSGGTTKFLDKNNLAYYFQEITKTLHKHSKIADGLSVKHASVEKNKNMW